MLKIKKQYKQPDGTTLEIEGSEAEIEAYEKKQQKKNESTQRKKEILHGKAAKKLAKNPDVMEELKRFLTQELQKLQAVREVHHWYFNNGWWWRPWYYNGEVTYIYSQTRPNAIYNGPVDSYYTTTNSSDLSQKIGVSTNEILTKPNLTYTSNLISNGVYGTTLSAGNISTSNYVSNATATAIPSNVWTTTAGNNAAATWTCDTKTLSNILKLDPDDSSVN